MTHFMGHIGAAGGPGSYWAALARPVLRSSGAAAAEGGCPAGRRAPRLVYASGPADRCAPMKWVNIKDGWYQHQRWPPTAVVGLTGADKTLSGKDFPG